MKDEWHRRICFGMEQSGSEYFRLSLIRGLKGDLRLRGCQS